MSKEQKQIIKEIDKELEEKKSKLQGLSTEMQKAKTFLQQNEPVLFSLNGAVQQLEDLKRRLLSTNLENNKK